MFDSKKIVISETADARKEKREGEQTWKLLQEASEILVAKGKKTVNFSPGQTDKETILASVLGRSGTLRAPTIRIGRRFLVGFNEEMYMENL